MNELDHGSADRPDLVPGAVLGPFAGRAGEPGRQRSDVAVALAAGRPGGFAGPAGSGAGTPDFLWAQLGKI